MRERKLDIYLEHNTSHLQPLLTAAGFKAQPLFGKNGCLETFRFKDLKSKKNRFQALRWGAILTDNPKPYSRADQIVYLYSLIICPPTAPPNKVIAELTKWSEDYKPAETNTLWRIEFDVKGSMKATRVGSYRGDESDPRQQIWKNVIVLDRCCDEYRKPLEQERFMVIPLPEKNSDHYNVLCGRALLTKRPETFQDKQLKDNFDLISIPNDRDPAKIIPRIDKALKKHQVDKLQRCWRLVVPSKGPEEFTIIPEPEDLSSVILSDATRTTLESISPEEERLLRDRFGQYWRDEGIKVPMERLREIEATALRKLRARADRDPKWAVAVGKNAQNRRYVPIDGNPSKRGTTEPIKMTPEFRRSIELLQKSRKELDDLLAGELKPTLKRPRRRRNKEK